MSFHAGQQRQNRKIVVDRYHHMMKKYHEKLKVKDATKKVQLGKL